MHRLLTVPSELPVVEPHSLVTREREREIGPLSTNQSEFPVSGATADFLTFATIVGGSTNSEGNASRL